ncbi:hypothetical protein [Niameybacter massiliensis]|uniref:hypothetical protein n=1 Tax=Niameybacter massiliensis TaxID=1658108 RepID=UPI0006B54221|nr:hypothetical protein [Niameybacter massiliensis]
MIIYVSDENTVLWSHSDNSVKSLEAYMDDPRCIRVPDDIVIPIVPQDDYMYRLVYHEESQGVTLEKLCKRPLTEKEIIERTHGLCLQSGEDSLMSVELGLDTNGKVTTAGNDSLLLMELLTSIDEKLNQLLSQKA